jgi:3-oxoisoapionate kinase
MSILYTFYGDDFTGSTDVLEQLASNGVPTVLYLKPPTREHLAAFSEAQAVGIAGDSRSRTPEWMSQNLPVIFTTLKSFNAPIAHYKICSTFDSSPTCGSIGRAIELGREVFDPRFIPIVVGAPHLRRYIAFGNLFAAAPDGAIQRIDRHPMSHHPVTPMREADLRLHLASQTAMPIGLVDLPALQNSSSAASALDAELRRYKQAILFDTVDAHTHTTVGELLWSEALQRPLFSASSSGLTAAIIHAWRKQNLLSTDQPSSSMDKASSPLLVLSGSCSPATEHQIRYALAHGYHGIAIDPATLITNAEAIADAATASLDNNRNTVLYTSLGPHSSAEAHGDRLGSALGHLLRRILTRTTVHRVLFCGGDTTSHAVQQLGLYALTWRASLQPGAPLCLTHAEDPRSPLDHLEVVFKGGQVGTEDFFEVVRGGSR